MARASFGLPWSNWHCSWYSSSFWYFRLRFCAATFPPRRTSRRIWTKRGTRPYQAGWAGSAGLKTRHYKSAHARLPDAGRGRKQAGATGGEEGEDRSGDLREGPTCGRALRVVGGDQGGDPTAAY